jgi:sugar (glycoside-pentoside-hexuronide) transporter
MVNERQVFSRVPLKEIIGYATGDFAILLYLQMITMYLLFFYTDIFGLSAVTVGFIFLFARIWDGINDPVMGGIVDRIGFTRWGKFRPYLLWGSVPIALLAVATFTVPNLTDTGMIIYASSTYVLFGMAYTFITIPYGALTTAITEDPNQRTQLTAVRGFFAVIGGFIVAAATLPLVEVLGGGTAARGWQLVMVIYALLATFMFLICFKSTRERLAVKRERKHGGFREMVEIVKLNRQLQYYCLSMMTFLIGYTICQSVIIYYFKYNLGREELVPLFLVITVVAMLAGVFPAAWLSGKLGKRNTLVLGYGIMLIAFLLIFISPTDNIVLLFALGSLIGLGMAFHQALNWSMVADTVEFGEWKTGVRAEGVTYSVATLSQKIALALAGMTAGGVLGYFGYVANIDQTAEALLGIKLLLTIIPAFFCLLSMLALIFYNLDSYYLHIVAELEVRRNE